MKEESLCCHQKSRKLRNYNKKKIASISAPLHLVLKPPLSPTATPHSWKNIHHFRKLCQVCHLVVDGGEGLRCKACGLKVHPKCGGAFSNSSSNAPRPPVLFYRKEEPLKKSFIGPPKISPAKLYNSSIEDNSSVAASTALPVAASYLGTASLDDEDYDITGGSVLKTPEVATSSTAPHTNTYNIHSQEEEEEDLPDSGFAGFLDDCDDYYSACGSSSTRHQNTKTPQKKLLHVDGPLDGSPYAVVVAVNSSFPASVQRKNNRRVEYRQQKGGGHQYQYWGPPKKKTNPPSPIKNMKDLDNLLTALVHDADSIRDTPTTTNNNSTMEDPTIPYHARQDSLPFSYTSSSRYIVPEGTSSKGADYRVPPKQQPVYSHPTAPTNTNNGNRSLSTSASFSGGGRNNQYSYNRSHSADGRRRQQEDGSSGCGGENPDEWLARQMKKLQEKQQMSSSSAMGVRGGGLGRPDWLSELKRALPQRREQQSEDDDDDAHHPQQQSAAGHRRGQQMETRQHGTTPTYAYPHHHHQEPPLSSSRPAQRYSPIPAPATSTIRTEPPDSETNLEEDDEEDLAAEREIGHVFRQRSRNHPPQIKRHHSESAYDHTARYQSHTSSRAPSQQSTGDTPNFPACPPTPYTNYYSYGGRPLSPPGKPPRSPNSSGSRRRYDSSHQEESSRPTLPPQQQSTTPPTNLYSSREKTRFTSDSSEWWYKPHATREETVSALLQSSAGSFIIRNSNSFPGAFGLAVRVHGGGADDAEKGIRHFLIEPTRFGVRLRGCGDVEPVFGSLSALVYAHSVEPLALPTTLHLPASEFEDVLPSSQSQSTTAHLLRQGAACQLLFLGIASVESLSGEEAIAKGVGEISAASPVPISLRLSRSGLTLTDVFRKMFFRLHFALPEVLYASVVSGKSVVYNNLNKQVFGIVARAPRAVDNSVIVLAELEQGQPAGAIVAFVQRVVQWQK